MATAATSADQIQKTPFVKELASSDRKTRDKALESLTRFLRARRDLSLLELLKIWKGLFFCFYHSDRPLTQQALARELSYTLVPSLPRESRLRFLRAFWITIGRDFHALDRIRLDKYLFLIRCYVGVAFEVFLAKKIELSSNVSNDGERDGKKRKRQDKKSNGGKRRKQDTEDEESAQHNNNNNNNNANDNGDDDGEGNGTGKWSELESYIALLEQGPLCPINFDPNENTDSVKKSEDESIPMPHGPDGLRYHLTDIWLDELAKVIDNDKNSNSDSNSSENVTLKDRYDIPIDLLLRPFEKLSKDSPTKSVRQRASTEVLQDERLIQWGFKEKPVESASEDDEDEEWGGIDD